MPGFHYVHNQQSTIVHHHPFKPLCVFIILFFGAITQHDLDRLFWDDESFCLLAFFGIINFNKENNNESML